MLRTERQVRGLDVDAFSLNPGLETGPFPVHHIRLSGGRWGMECLAPLDAPPEMGAHLALGAPKVRGGTGGLSRVIAPV